MQEQETKKAILVVSFGTTHEETRKVTIDAIERDLAQAFPDRRLYRGWTSRMIVRRLRERGICFDTLEEALCRMQEDGIRDVLVQPTHLISGWENDRMLQLLREHAAGFRAITVGRPLLDTDADHRQMAQILAEEYLQKEEAGDLLVLMGHGSSDKPEVNRIYPLMERAFRDMGCQNVIVGTVEGEPGVEDVLQQLGELRASVRTVHLAPLMIVAGDHAKNDMAGDGEESWKNLIEERGFSVRVHLRGLGEIAGVRSMILQHALETKSLETL